MESRSNNDWQVGEHVDYYDEKLDKWSNAEIQKVTRDKVRIHHSGYSQQYDEELPKNSKKIQKQWRRGMPLRKNNRVDVWDKNFKWYEATIADISDKKVLANYRGFSRKYDEWIDVEAQPHRIREVGSYSNAHGWAKNSMQHQDQLRQESNQLQVAQSKESLGGSGSNYLGSNLGRNMGLGSASSLSSIDSNLQKPSGNLNNIDWEREENKFKLLMQKKNMRIVGVGTDGNCLFRAVSHQIYGSEDLHDLIRQKCMDYITSEKEYFQDFIVGGEETFDAYINRKRSNGVWGDDLEIQALSEIYDRPIEIFAYSNEPMRTFHEQKAGNEPIRLSYHGRSHYNSVVPLNWSSDRAYVKSKPGDVEDIAIMYSRNREDEQQESTDKETNITDDNQELQANQTNNLQKFQGLPRTEENLKLYRYIIQKSREEFGVQGKSDMDKALELSLQEQQNQYKKFNESLKEESNSQVSQEQKNISETVYQSNLQYTEEELIKMAIAESIDEQKKKEDEAEKLRALRNNQSSQQFEDIIMKTVMEMSKKDYHMPVTDEMSPAVKMALANGYTQEQAIEAVSLYGENQELVMSYLFERYSDIK